MRKISIVLSGTRPQWVNTSDWKAISLHDNRVNSINSNYNKLTRGN